MKINWTEIGDNDFTALSGDYLLRAEKMNKGHWWWCVYFKNEMIDSSMFSDEVATTKKQALKAAEKCYKKHLESQLK
jgi:hypothetical protein